MSVTYALRQAIADSAFLQDEVVSQQNKLVVKSKDGSSRHVSVLR